MSAIGTELEKAPWNMKLKVMRVMIGLTMNEAANLCCTDKSIYCNWEHGKFFPRRDSIRAIQRAFNLSDQAIQEIFG